MRISILAFIILIISISSSQGQSKTLEYLEDEYESSFKLVLYYSTLKVFSNQSEESFFELIKDIEKVYILRMEEIPDDLDKSFFDTVDQRVMDEGYEELLKMRSGVDTWSAFYVKESMGQISGFFLVLMEGNSINCVDLQGHVPIDKLSELVNKVDFQSIDKLF